MDSNTTVSKVVTKIDGNTVQIVKTTVVTTTETETFVYNDLVTAKNDLVTKQAEYLSTDITDMADTISQADGLGVVPIAPVQ